MKNVFILLSLFVFANGMSQRPIENNQGTNTLPTYSNAVGLTDTEAASLIGNLQDWSKIMGVFYEFDNIDLVKKGIDGSVFLFDNWNNDGVINVGKKKYRISKINFHIEKGVFMSKLETDSTFVFNNTDIDSVAINKRYFKKFYNSEDGIDKFYEVIHENKQFSIIKEYRIRLIEGSPNPMLNRRKSEIKQERKYFVLKSRNILPFKLSKKSVLGLVNSDMINSLNKYVKINNLSFKKEADLNKMLNHIFDL